MKKSILLICSIIFFLAIYVVGTHVASQVWNPAIYVETITCLHESYVAYTEEEKAEKDLDGYIKYGSKANKPTYPAEVELIFRVTPDDATEKTLEFVYDTELTFVTVTANSDSSCIVRFENGGSFDLRVNATDRAGGASMKLNIDAYRKIL